MAPKKATKKKKAVISKAMPRVLTSAAEFQIGKHSIGWMSDSFKDNFLNQSFEVRPLPTFQKLSRSMNDAAIESELKPGFCELGDIVAFLDHAPEECKDGYANLFYTPSFVVSVRWYSYDRMWYVSTWRRGGRGWDAGRRVFSPATGAVALTSGPSDTLSLERAVELVKKAGYRIFKEI